MKKVLTIAGSDCSGGAGIQADLKTMTVHGVYGMSVITALTAQNTTGVYGITDASPEFVGKQMDCVFTDIVPDAVKIGMVSNSEIIGIIAERLTYYHAKNIVLDPIMIATSKSELLQSNARETLMAKFFPVAGIITPNLYEAEILSGVKTGDKNGMINAAEKIAERFQGGILIKGGHLKDTADDLLYTNQKAVWIRGERVDNPNTHGTGCTLSSAIACNLAKGYCIEDSVRRSKKYLTEVLKAGLDLGRQNGPLNHMRRQEWQ